LWESPGMLRLLLLRHAKAVSPQSGTGDSERVLEQRGRKDATLIGAYMQRHGFIPDRALVSPAARTRETWTQLATELGKAVSADFDETIYAASAEALLSNIKTIGPKVRTLIVVGHNPGLHELATMLVASGDIDERQQLREKFPTAALAIISFAVESWTGLHKLGGRLEHFVTPKSLESAMD
jgi:phosphohistidine phosphatase